jgi:hypothetical protein
VFPVKARIHERHVQCGTVVAKISSNTPISPGRIVEIAREIVKNVARKCTEEGAKAISHVKLYLKSMSGYLRVDTVGLEYGVDVEGNLSNSEREITLVMNSVIIGLEEDKMAKAMMDGIKEVLALYGLAVELERLSHVHGRSERAL